MRLLFMIVALLGVVSASNCPWKWCNGGGKREVESSAAELSQDPPGTFPEDEEPPKAVAKREAKSSKCPWKWCKDGKREAESSAAELSQDPPGARPYRKLPALPALPGCTIVSTTKGELCVYPGKRDVAASDSAAELSQDPPGTFPEDEEPPKAVAKREAKSSKCPWKWCKDGKREAESSAAELSQDPPYRKFQLPTGTFPDHLQPPSPIAKREAKPEPWNWCNLYPKSSMCKGKREAAAETEEMQQWCIKHPEECQRKRMQRDDLCGLAPLHPSCPWGQMCLRKLAAKDCEKTRKLIQDDPVEFRKYQHLLPKREAMQGRNEHEEVSISDRS